MSLELEQTDQTKRLEDLALILLNDQALQHYSGTMLVWQLLFVTDQDLNKITMKIADAFGKNPQWISRRMYSNPDPSVDEMLTIGQYLGMEDVVRRWLSLRPAAKNVKRGGDHPLLRCLDLEDEDEDRINAITLEVAE